MALRIGRCRRFLLCNEKSGSEERVADTDSDDLQLQFAADEIFKDRSVLHGGLQSWGPNRLFGGEAFKVGLRPVRCKVYFREFLRSTVHLRYPGPPS